MTLLLGGERQRGCPKWTPMHSKWSMKLDMDPSPGACTGQVAIVIVKDGSFGSGVPFSVASAPVLRTKYLV
jgi:hypothetical protein